MRLLIMKVFAFIINMLLCTNLVHAQENDSSYVEQSGQDMQVSLITCSPGTEIHAFFGHTAIRVIDKQNRRDIVFNYGMFNYKTENFIYKFVKGETFYELGAEPADFFFERYNERNVNVTEQILNLTPEEKIQIQALLFENLLPENRLYKYNWLYDNCATRARDMIEKVIDGKVQYGESSYADLTTREILRKHTSVNSWIEFGIDMLLGTEIDKPLTKRQQMFIPSNLQEQVSHAVIHNSDNTTRNLVLATSCPIKHDASIKEDKSHMALIFTTGLLLLTILLTFYEIKRKKIFKWFDVILAFCVGTIGLLISFLFFFSDHPGVSTNYLVIIFNPLAYLTIPFIIKRKTKILSYVILADIIIFILTIVLVQQTLNTAILPLASILLVRVIVNIIFFHIFAKQKNNTETIKLNIKHGIQ
ncbi:MAG: DUF4105 domain-containing protein [Bacteroidaceae bacterium]|nr:DUF4105 domain-containing protein [Bacteroidaceae bacterium]